VSSILTSQEYRQNLIDAFYVRALGRHADPVSLQLWVGALASGTSETDVLTAIASSPEFFANAGGTVEGFIEQLYFGVLGRTTVLVSEVDSWIGRMTAPVTRLDVANAFTHSLEFRLQLLNGTNLAFGDWYPRYLGRPLDLQGAQAWLTALNFGATWFDVQRSLLTSQEASNR
jgi:hypothetical protein